MAPRILRLGTAGSELSAALSHCFTLCTHCIGRLGVATRLGLDGPGIESRWWLTFPGSFQTDLRAYAASCTMDTGSFPRVKRAGRGVDHSPHLGLRLEKD